jgi:hypothetical protein
MSDPTIYQLSIRGTLAPPTLEAARAVHNRTAGNPATVPIAQSMGDLSHMVYMPTGPLNGNAADFLFLDLWNNLDGLNQFFANPQIQAEAGQIFAEHDAVVWTPAEGFISYHMPATYGKNDRLVGTVRGMLRSLEDGKRVHNALVGKFQNKARLRGNISHDAYLRLTPPGEAPSLEFFAVDVWTDAAGMGEHYNDPAFLSGFGELFATRPDAAVWTRPAGEWVEW